MPWLWSLAATPLARAVLRPFMGRQRLIGWSHRRAYFEAEGGAPAQVDIIAEAYRQPGYTDHILGMAETMLAAPDEELLWAALPEIKAPVLIVWGRQDPTLPVRQAYAAAQRMPRSEIIIYERCGHLPMYEKADDFNRDLVAFIGRRAG